MANFISFTESPETKKYNSDNSSNLSLEDFYYKKYFKFYEISFLIFIAYIGLMCHKHGISYIVLYYTFSILPILTAAKILQQIEDNNQIFKINLSNKLTKYYFFSVDFLIINSMPKYIVKNHIYRKFYMCLLGPMVVFLST